MEVMIDGGVIDWLAIDGLEIADWPLLIGSRTSLRSASVSALSSAAHQLPVRYVQHGSTGLRLHGSGGAYDGPCILVSSPDRTCIALVLYLYRTCIYISAELSYIWILDWIRCSTFCTSTVQVLVRTVRLYVLYVP